MQRHLFSGRNRALAVLLCLCMMLLLVGSSAQAEITKVTLTVKAADNFADEAEEQDFADANVVVDLYQVGSAVKDAKYDTYSYNLLAPFDGLTLKEDMTTEDWEKLSGDAANVASGATPVVTGAAVGSKIEKTDGGADLEQGLYLVIAHGEGKEDLYAESSKYGYTFSPQLVTLPAKEDANGDGTITTAVDDGEWLADASITLKYEKSDLFGSITIYKTVKDFEGEEALFIFLIEIYDGEELVGSNSKMIRIGKSGTESATLDRIPVGTRVVVKEDYKGGRFECVGEDVQEIEVVTASGPNAVYFENKPNGSVNGSHGIENAFTNEVDENGKAHWRLVKQ